MQDESFSQFDEDIRLMVKTKRGDRQAYARLYEKYVPIVKRYIAGRDTQAESQKDLVQEVFTRVWERRGRYRFGTPVYPYLLGFATNVIREHQTRVRRETAMESRGCAWDICRVDAGPEAVICQNEMAERLMARLTELGPKQRRALELVYLAHVSIAQAAEIMNCSRDALRRNLYEARQRLHRALLPESDEPGSP